MDLTVTDVTPRPNARGRVLSREEVAKLGAFLETKHGPVHVGGYNVSGYGRPNRKQRRAGARAWRNAMTLAANAFKALGGTKAIYEAIGEHITDAATQNPPEFYELDCVLSTGQPRNVVRAALRIVETAGAIAPAGPEGTWRVVKA